MCNDKQIKIIFLGDLVGKPGRVAAREFLTENKADFVIVNGENASHGFGLSEKNYNEILGFGVDCITSGNHIWDKNDIEKYINQADKLIRPLNYPDCVFGQGYRIFQTNNIKIGVINLLGRTFMQPVDCPFKALKSAVEEIKKETPIIFVDFHAEATAEKITLSRFSSELGVSVLVGTHTHVQTADEKIINNMAYISDAGFCGSYEGVIGMEYKSSYKRLISCINQKFEPVKSGKLQINGVEVEIDLNGNAKKISRIYKELEAE